MKRRSQHRLNSEFQIAKIKRKSIGDYRDRDVSAGDNKSVLIERPSYGFNDDIVDFDRWKRKKSVSNQQFVNLSKTSLYYDVFDKRKVNDVDLNSQTLNAIDLYAALQLNVATSNTSDFEQLLSTSYTHWQTFFENQKVIFDENKLQQFAFKILGNSISRNVYNRQLQIKNQFIKQAHPFVMLYNSSVDEIDAIKTDMTDFEKNYDRDKIKNIFMSKINVSFDKSVYKNLPRKNISFNRLLVRWHVEDPDDPGENVTIDIIKQHFGQYGYVNAAVICNGERNCAIIEFLSMDSMIEAKNDTMYQVEDYNEKAVFAKFNAISDFNKKFDLLEKMFNEKKLLYNRLRLSSNRQI